MDVSAEHAFKRELHGCVSLLSVSPWKTVDLDIRNVRVIADPHQHQNSPNYLL